ncbi:MAG: tRNA pseudouridine(55) synthase TruB [Bacilli bacterium]|nr:tRNA pseudouridine(55) synthase TruB [Bacilli bacterium]
MNGILVVNKEENFTSRDVVNKLSHILNTKRIGHTGTLDPIATGVLVITIGKYTKLSDALMSKYKEYIAEFIIGKSTDTLDITGNILEEKEANISNDEIIKAINNFKRSYNQEVPIFSAVKVNGKKLYEYARNNESVELPSKIVDIKEIEVLDIKDNIVKFKCLVSKGTYIRSLIRDIGISLNIPTCMKSLVRTKQGNFKIEDSYTLKDIENNKFKLLDIDKVLDLDIIDIDKNKDIYKRVINGIKFDLNISSKPFVLFKRDNEKIAIYKRESDNYRMFIKLED